MERILIAGCGDVGGKLASNLAAEGHEVWGIRRSGDLPAHVEPLLFDLASPESYRSLPPGLSVVFYTASADSREENRYRAAYVEGLRHLLEALKASDQELRRIFFTSSTSVYHQRDGSWVDEASATHPEGFAGRVMLEAEAVLRRAPWPTTIVRLAGIYGPGRTRLITRVIEGAIAQHSPPYYTNRIHRDDCSRCLQHLMHLEEPDEVYLGSDSEPASLHSVFSFLREHLGIEPMDDARSVPANATAERGSNKRCSNRRLLATGFRFAFPSFREGYTELLGNMGNQNSRQNDASSD